jgi:hypothetical protein
MGACCRLHRFTFFVTPGLLPLATLAMVILRTADDMLLFVIWTGGVLLIIGKERRWLHNSIAGSKAVMHQKDHQQVS